MRGRQKKHDEMDKSKFIFTSLSLTAYKFCMVDAEQCVYMHIILYLSYFVSVFSCPILTSL